MAKDWRSIPDIPKYQPKDIDRDTIFALKGKINKELRPNMRPGGGLDVLLNAKKAEGKNFTSAVKFN